MAGDIPPGWHPEYSYMNLNSTTGWVPPQNNTGGWTYYPTWTYYPSYVPYTPVPSPCPSCGHCPTCGTNRLPPYIRTITVADTTNGVNGLDVSGTSTFDTCPIEPDEGNCEHD